MKRLDAKTVHRYPISGEGTVLEIRYGRAVQSNDMVFHNRPPVIASSLEQARYVKPSLKDSSERMTML